MSRPESGSGLKRAPGGPAELCIQSRKARLSRAFGGKRGKALSKAIVAAGFDGIVTIDRGEPAEVVDLTRL